MSLKEEQQKLKEEQQKQQKKEKLWNALGLSEKNKELAEVYLDITQPEQEELLKQVEHQSFRKDWNSDDRWEYFSYLDECARKGFKEEKKRYIRFVAEVGGSTSFYVLSGKEHYYGLTDEELSNYLTREQMVAIQAECYVWDSYDLREVTKKIKETNPDVFRKAIELCYDKYQNTKALLIGLTLFYTEPIEVSEENKEKQEQIQKLIDAWMKSFISTVTKNTVKTGEFSEEEKNVIKEFIEELEENMSVRMSDLRPILSGKTYNRYLIALDAGVAFLVMKHSKKFWNCLKLLMLMDIENKENNTLDICLNIHTKEWFFEHQDKLEAELPIDKKMYFTWCVEHKIDHSIKKMVVNGVEIVKETKDSFSAEECLYLLDFIKNEDSKLYEEMKSYLIREYETKVVQGITERIRTNSEIVKKYLLNEVELEEVYPYVKEWQENRYYISSSDVWEKITVLKQLGNEQLFERVCVFMALLIKTSFFVSDWMKYDKKEEVENIIQTLSKQNLAKKYQLELLASIYEYYSANTYGETKRILLKYFVQVLFQKKEQWEDDILELTKEGSVVARQFYMEVLNVYAKQYKEVLLSCVTDSSKQIKSMLVTIYARHKEWESDIKEWLTSKKSQEREMAVLVLKEWGIDSYKTELLQAIEQEKSKKLKELMQSCLGIQTETVQKEQTNEELVKEILKGGRKRVVAWLYETKVPVVHKLDGLEASEDYMKAILVSYSGMPSLGVNADANRLAKELEPKELSDYMQYLFGIWLELGAEAKKKWLLYAVAIHGGEAIVPMFSAQIQKWAEAMRGAMAVEGVKALALNGGSTALLLVDQIARKFRYRQVKEAASKALEEAAVQLGISKAELEDKIVPNLEFNEQMERVFDYGSRKFVVSLTPSLELLITDETGKKIKNLPAPAKKDEEKKAKEAYEAYKLLKKQLKTVVTNQKIRLEQALSNERLWSATNWNELFVKNPIMHQFAIGLIWGHYEDGKLKETFRYMEDGSFNTMDEDEYEWNEEAMIGLVHPMELSKEELEVWKEQLADYEITQPIEQLEREIYRITEEEKEQTELTRFGGKVLNGLSLVNKLLSLGWRRGEIGDGGWYKTLYKEDGTVGVELEFSGVSIGWEGENVTVYGVQFYKVGEVVRDRYDKIKQECLYSLQEISPRYFSEIVLLLTKVTASSVEQLDYPECKR